MKIALMGGAYVNAGDFLIEKRSRELLEYNLNCDVDVFKRNLAYDDKIEMLNSYDAIVFAGGPVFQNIYPEKMPFVKNLEEIKVPIVILGGGWKGRNIFTDTIYKNYQLSSEMMKFISHIEQNGKIGCRDWHTVRMLGAKGITNVEMTGCPVWYDVTKISDLQLKPKYNEVDIKDTDITIGISDPAMSWNRKRLFELMHLLRENYPNAKLKVFFHRGISAENKKEIELLRQSDERISYVDMSGSCDMFEEYNECFMHIGFRVHAHIYNLSQGNLSVLINEDARGNGVNQALGIEDINCGQRSWKNKFMNEDVFEKVIMDYLQFIVETDYAQYHQAYENMKRTYVKMEQYIKNII